MRASDTFVMYRRPMSTRVEVVQAILGEGADNKSGIVVSLRDAGS